MAKRRVDQHDRYWQMTLQLRDQGAMFFTDNQNGDIQAQRTADARGWQKFRLPTVDSWIVAPPDVYASIVQGSAGGGASGGGAGAGGTGTAGGALAAVQHQPAYTGGGAYFPGGAVENRVAGLSERDDEWLGLDTLTPDERLATGRSPNAVNWDDIRRIGSRCVRSGTAKLDDDRDTVTISSSSISADYRGLSLAAMPGSGDNQNKLLICFADNSIGSTRTAQVTTMHLCATSLRWGKPLNLTGWPGPKLALSDQTGNVLRVTYDYTNVFSTANDGLRKASVKGIIIRYSLLGYPLDRDGLDNRNDYPTPLRDRTAWGGESATVDTTATAAFSGQRVYVSAWAFGVEGFSEPSHASLTMA